MSIAREIRMRREPKLRLCRLVLAGDADATAELVRRLCEGFEPPKDITELMKRCPYLEGKLTARVFDALADAWLAFHVDKSDLETV